MARLLLAVFALLACAAEAFMAPASAAVGRTSTVQMSTQFTDPFVKAMKKKNPMTGSTKNLKGYTVGSRAPIVSKSSGTRITTSYKKEANVVRSDGGLKSAGEKKSAGPIVILAPLLLAAAAYYGQ